MNVFAIVAVGNFRCNEAFLLHAIGAFSMFNCTFAQAGLLIYICSKLSAKYGIESRPVTMAIGSICMLVSLMGCVVFSTVAVFQFGYDNFFDEYKRLHWTRSQVGYWWHVLGTGCEWLLLNSNAILFLCLFRRMKEFKEWHKVQL